MSRATDYQTALDAALAKQAAGFRCDRCRYLICEDEAEHGWCAGCRGVSSFILTPAQSRANQAAYAYHVAGLVARAEAA